MQVARLTFAARRRSDQPFRIFPLTIYEAKFREKLTNNFQEILSSNLGRPGMARRRNPLREEPKAAGSGGQRAETLCGMVSGG